MSPETGIPWPRRVGFALYALGSCLALYGLILLGRARLDLPALAAALRQLGLSLVPAITLVMATLGLILGSQTASVLGRLDLPGLILPTFSYAVVMELVPILIGILVAGRAGVALAVRQAGLVVSGEMDGLLVTGVHPIRFSLGPALLAMLLMSFAFTVWGTLVTFAVAALWLWHAAAVPPSLFLNALERALDPEDLATALGKPLLFALAIALVATVSGTLVGRTPAGREPAGIGLAATRTMIGAVSVILLIDLLFALTPG